MKSLISINDKFMEVNPKRLIELVKESKYTDGVEAYINLNNPFEMKYLDDLVFEINKNNLILQIHGNSRESLEDQIKYIKKLESYSDILGYPIVLTLHSVYDEDKDVSIEKTIEYFSDLLKNINSNKIIISIENLNDADNMDRLEKECIRPIILNDEKIFFTYDIGHELADYGNITALDKYMIEDIRNIHIHTNNGKGVDHRPIYKNDIHWNELMKGLIFLINNKYEYNIVYEYDLNACYGNNIEEKIKDYLKSIDYVSEKYRK